MLASSNTGIELISNPNKIIQFKILEKMKRIYFMVLIANALIISGLTSCKKEDLSSGPGNPSATTQPSTINLVAGRWVKNTDGIYVSTFPGILSPANTSNRTVKIYLLANGR